MDAATHRTTEQRLAAPLNGTIYTTRRDVPMEKPLPALGSSMGSELGTLWSDSTLCQANHDPASGKRVLILVHARIPTETQQLASNWHYGTADLGERRFPSVVRTVILPAAAIQHDSPARGSAMPSVSGDAFAGKGYILADRQTIPTGTELEPVFRAEQRTYLQRSTIASVAYDPATGRGKREVMTLYYRGESVTGGQAIETLMAAPANAYWGLQADGTYRTGEQLTADWFAVTASAVIPANAEADTGNHPKAEVVERPTPNFSDRIVRYKGAMPDPVPAVGTAHPNGGNYPNHRLVAIRPADESGKLHEFIYAASRSSQDAYNFQITEEDELVRTYIIPRADYFGSPPAFAPRTVGSADLAFPKYGYAHEFLIRLEDELDGLFVGVRRVFKQIVKVRKFYDDELDLVVTETTTIIPKDSGSAAAAAGMTREIQNVNTFYDLQVVQQAEGEWPKFLRSIPRDLSYNFPAFLRSARLVRSWAIAESGSAQTAFDEAYYIDWDLVEPLSGPYGGRVIRVLTAAPEAVRGEYPLTRITVARENIGVSNAWAHASDRGNSAKASSLQIEVPPSIHGEITVQGSESLGSGYKKAKLAATPGWEKFVRGNVMNVGYETTKTRYGLYIAEVTQVDYSGLYSTSASGAITSGTGTFPGGTPGNPDGAPEDKSKYPKVFSAAFNRDNTTVTGRATPGARVYITTATLDPSFPTAIAPVIITEYGETTVEANGSFSMPIVKAIDSIGNYPVSISLNGLAGGYLTIRSYDSAPVVTAAINSARNYISGKTKPSSRVYLSEPGSRQIETVTVVGTIASSGDLDVVLRSDHLPGSPITIGCSTVVGMTAADVASEIHGSLQFTDLTEHYEITLDGASVILTALSPADNDYGLNIAIANGTSAGLTEAPTSVNTRAGRAPREETVVAGFSGNFSALFLPALIEGAEVTIHAERDGKIGPSIVLIAATAVPVLGLAEFVEDSYTTIAGEASSGSKVIALLDGVEVGDTIASGGMFELVLSPGYGRGEVLEIVAVNSFDARMRSGSIYMPAPEYTFDSLDLQETSTGIAGRISNPDTEVTAIFWRELPDGPENEATLHANGRFLIDLPGGSNGEIYGVWARYPYFDGEQTVFSFPVIRLSAPQFYLAVPDADDVDDPFIAYVDTEFPGELANVRITTGGRNGGDFKTPQAGEYMLAIMLRGDLSNLSYRIGFPGTSEGDVTGTVTGSIIYLGEAVPEFPYTPYSDPEDGFSGLQYDADTMAAARPSKAQVLAAIPPLVEIELTHADGRTITVLFDRGKTYPFTLPEWQP